jgi:hypothetical protein
MYIKPTEVLFRFFHEICKAYDWQEQNSSKRKYGSRCAIPIFKRTQKTLDNFYLKVFCLGFRIRDKNWDVPKRNSSNTSSSITSVKFQISNFKFQMSLATLFVNPIIIKNDLMPRNHLL